jgi:cytochrome aa3-600 menaquinol oxidase subunit 2
MVVRGDLGLTGRTRSGLLRRFRWTLLPAAAAVSGCGSRYVVLHPAGPVAQAEMRLMLLAALAMGLVILFVFVLLAIAAFRFRDVPGRRAPYVPEWHESRALEWIWFSIPVLLLAVIAVPTVRLTYTLAAVPTGESPLVIDVTSLTWKWLFEYPEQHVATVNYVEIPTGRTVLFELTANSPMNTFWVPQLGGMEYAMPGEVLPLWLRADRAGTYWGHSANFSGLHFAEMFFAVQAVPPAEFARWVGQVQRSAPAMTLQDYRRLLTFGTVGTETYSAYPAQTFPPVTHGFGLTGGQYVPVQAGYQAMRMPGEGPAESPVGNRE